MDPLITNGIDPALLRVLEKRGQEREGEMRRRRPPVPQATAEEEEPAADPEAPKHELDDLA